MGRNARQNQGRPAMVAASQEPQAWRPAFRGKGAKGSTRSQGKGFGKGKNGGVASNYGDRPTLLGSKGPQGAATKPEAKQPSVAPACQRQQPPPPKPQFQLVENSYGLHLEVDEGRHCYTVPRLDLLTSQHQQEAAMRAWRAWGADEAYKGQELLTQVEEIAIVSDEGGNLWMIGAAPTQLPGPEDYLAAVAQAHWLSLCLWGSSLPTMEASTIVAAWA